MRNVSKLVIAALGASMFASVAHAELKGANYESYIEDHYKTVTRTYPQYAEQCTTRDVPIFGKTKDTFDEGGAVVGGIIGGIAGNAIKHGPVGAGVGAIAGAVIGGREEGDREVVGYKQVTDCQKVLVHTERYDEEEYTHSTVSFYYNGEYYKMTFTDKNKVAKHRRNYNKSHLTGSYNKSHRTNKEKWDVRIGR